MVESNGGEVFDVGGLRGTGAGTAALAGRIWRDLDSDAIHFTDDATFTTRVRNAVRLDGAIQAPDAFAADLLEGFDATYRLLLAHREALLAADGPLAAFAGTPVRVLPRPTTQYASLIYLLSRPKYQKDGCRWSTAFDALNRAVNGLHDAPEVWPVLVSERKALEGLDVPHFTVLADDTAVRVGRRVLIEQRYARSGLAAVKDCVAALSPADLQAQLVRISRALSETIHSRYSTEPEHAAHTELDVTSPDFLVDHALWIARELVDRGLDDPARHRLRRLGADGRDRAAAASPLRRLARPGGVPGRGRRRLGRGPLAAVRPGFRRRGQRRGGQGRGRRRGHRRRLRRGLGGLRPHHHRRAARRRHVARARPERGAPDRAAPHRPGYRARRHQRRRRRRPGPARPATR